MPGEKSTKSLSHREFCDCSGLRIGLWHSLLLQPLGSVGACRGLAEVRLQSASCLAARGAEDKPRSQQHLLFGWPGESLMESTR